jgi:signal transduction histidine kinase
VPQSIGEALAALDVALYERRASGELELVSTAPGWLASSGARGLSLPRDRRDESLHPFLAHFLRDAESFWSSPKPGRLRSDAWIEARAERSSAEGSSTKRSSADGTRRDETREHAASDAFRATALVLDDRRALLAIERLRDFAAEIEMPLQAARESRLHYERLQKEIDKKELLLHCIVHDLKGPLAGMLGVLSLMKQHELGAERVHELTELGVSQARKQEAMIQGILDAFASEISALEAFETDPARAPDLVRAVERAADMLRPEFERKGVVLALVLPSSQRSARESGGDALADSSPRAADPSTRVAGHAARLERVIANLLENALRHSPRASSVDLHVEPHGKSLRVAIDDRGPGISDEIRAHLFEKFTRDPVWGGTSGLGLYFCRMNVERWGGRIGCEPRQGGGTRFWFELPIAAAS